MKILLVNDHINIVSGAEKLAHAIKSALEKRNHIVRLFGSTKGENFASLFSRWYSLKWYNKARKVIKEFKPDIVHVLNCSRVVSPSVIKAALNSKTPVLLDTQDLSILCPRSGGLYDKSRPGKYLTKHKCFLHNCLGYDESLKDFPLNLWKLSKLKLHRKVMKDKRIFFAANSKLLSEALQKSLKVKSEIVHHGVAIPKKETNYRKNILFVGQMSKEKGLHTIAKKLNEVKGYKVLALGRGALKEKLESKYKNIEFLGFQKPEKYYEKTSIMVVPGIWLDTFPLTVLEAMSYGICVIASKLGGVPEQIKHMKTGLLFEPGNEKDFEKKLNYLLKNPGEIKRLGNNARKFIKNNFSWNKIAKEYEKIYLKTIKA